MDYGKAGPKVGIGSPRSTDTSEKDAIMNKLKYQTMKALNRRRDMKDKINGNIAADLARKLTEHGIPPELSGDRKPAMQMFIDPLSKKVDEWRQDDPDAVTGAAPDMSDEGDSDLSSRFKSDEAITPEGLAEIYKALKKMLGGN